MSVKPPQSHESALENRMVADPVSQFASYFCGKKVIFTARFDFPRGTNFQRLAWEPFRKLPYSQTRSYCEVVTAVWNPRGANHLKH
ncbi:MAG: hypothetical protein HY912_22045 [Desulfomonile tiedjei]|uniref:Uncharacterized protein n=1 Tax=Desulfomonile tiedjei TaxID=2358 RepID=A0A9D6V4Z2_9BACT|nr:hypothetical protein [Desulfomonile tiedjei]